MISQKPYLIRAIYEWCMDNDFLPHIAAMVDDRTIVPKQYVEEKKIILNIAANATKNLLIDNEWITFKATFGGTIQDIVIPVANVIAIFAKETGQGMQFQLEVNESNPESHENSGIGLKLVK